MAVLQLLHPLIAGANWREVARVAMDADHGAEDEEQQLQASTEVTALECRVTCTRHDDWLHRGPFLADLPWQAYMMLSLIHI